MHGSARLRAARVPATSARGLMDGNNHRWGDIGRWHFCPVTRRWAIATATVAPVSLCGSRLRKDQPGLLSAHRPCA